MHPWHDTYVDDTLIATALPVIVEIPKGSTNTYELDKKTGRDPSFAEYTDKAQLPGHVLRQVRRFFEDYKVLEHKQVVVEDMLGPDDAVRIIKEALEMYRQLRRGDLT